MLSGLTAHNRGHSNKFMPLLVFFFPLYKSVFLFSFVPVNVFVSEEIPSSS